MKKTKTVTVEVDVCDLCGEERQPWQVQRCVRCKKEVCGECVDRCRVDVSFHGRMERLGSCKSYSTGREPVLGGKVGYMATYCSGCSGAIQENLIAFGFVPHKAEPEGETTPDRAEAAGRAR